MAIVIKTPVVATPPTIPISEQLGVKRIWQWPITDLKSDLSIITTRIIEIFGAIKVGKWTVTCDLMYFKKDATATASINKPNTSSAANNALTSSTNGPPNASNASSASASASSSSSSSSSSAKEMYKVRFSSRPGYTYLISPSAVLESSNSMDSYLESLQICSIRHSTLFEGDEYSCGDFMIRIGTVRVGQKISGIILELEYLSCVLVNEGAFFLLAELAATILAGLPIAQTALSSSRPSSNWPDLANFNLPSVFTPKHAALMYVFAIGASKQQAAMGQQTSSIPTTSYPAPVQNPALPAPTQAHLPAAQSQLQGQPPLQSQFPTPMSHSNPLPLSTPSSYPQPPQPTQPQPTAFHPNPSSDPQNAFSAPFSNNSMRSSQPQSQSQAPTQSSYAPIPSQHSQSKTQLQW